MSPRGRTPKNYIDLSGKRFGRLTVIERSSEIGSIVKWLCRCDCGNYTTVASQPLRLGQTKSCGCLHDEVAGDSARTHGHSKTRLYAVWKDMRQRCFNQNNPNFYKYGARGITICAEWANSFEAFHDWAFANGYDPNAARGECTIDRINNDGNYEPSNCRWVSMKVQVKNRRPYQAPSHGKPVIRTDSSGEELWFPSVRAAAEALGSMKKQGPIAKCCRGESKSSYGYRWRFASK